jgi:tetratricopeptide (TPR) repeat protein
MKTNRLDEAIEEYKEATKLNPNYTDAYYNLGLVYHDKGFIDASIVSYQNALNFASNLSNINDIANIHNNLGNAYFKKKLYNKAIQHYEDALRIAPDNSYALRNLKIARRIFQHRVIK